MKDQLEIWKPIKGYEGIYEFSNLNNVKSLSRIIKKKNGAVINLKEKILKQTFNKGYYKVGLYLNGELSNLGIHQLVAMEHLGHTVCGLKLVVDHINEIKTDNRIENLQIITQRENIIKSLAKRNMQCDDEKFLRRTNKIIKSRQLNRNNFTLSIIGASRHLGISEYKMHSLIKKGTVKTFKLGKSPRISQEEIDRIKNINQVTDTKAEIY